MMLSTIRITAFIAALHSCVKLRTFLFDSDFLASDEPDNLQNYTLDQWLQLYKNRHHALQHSPYGWNSAGIGADYDWIDSPKHTNFHWYQLAEELAQRSGKPVTAFIFSGVQIAEEDHLRLRDPHRYADTYYNDENDSLIVITQVIASLRHNHRSTQFFSYSAANGVAYPSTLAELHQIRSKTSLICSADRKSQQTRWEYFCCNFVSHWSNNDVYDFRDLLYPLFDCVQHYFVSLDLDGELKSSQAILRDLYNNQLQHLSIPAVNLFYGQRISLYSDLANECQLTSDYLINVLLDVMDCELPEDILPQMIGLVEWMSTQNPSMVIHHDAVNQVNKKLMIGPFFTRERIRTAFEKLLADPHSRELRSTEQAAIHDLCFSLQGTLTDDEIFSKIREIYIARDKHNAVATFLDIRPALCINSSYEYIYYQKGLNFHYIFIAQLLAGCGFLNRHGMDDYFRLLMPSLTGSVSLIMAEPWSALPLSHYVFPENTRTYLCSLPAAERNYRETRCFENVEGQCLFTADQYECIQLYSAVKFRSYPRVPDYQSYKLKASTLGIFVDLVNKSFHYEGLDDDYSLVTVRDFPVLLEKRCIYLKVSDGVLSYRVQDLWDQSIYTDIVTFEKAEFKNQFLSWFDTEKRKLTYMLDVMAKKGHVRPGYSKAHYERSSTAFEHAQKRYLLLDTDERDVLNSVSVYFDGRVRTFAEIWAHGSPDCMSRASKWISIFLLNYLPDLIFSPEIEKYHKYAYLPQVRSSLRRGRDLVYNDVTYPGVDLSEYFSMKTWPSTVSNLLALSFHVKKSSQTTVRASDPEITDTESPSGSPPISSVLLRVRG